MQKAKVYFISNDYLKKLRQVLEKTLPVLKGNWAIKLHMGEYGNLHYLPPPIAELTVSVIKNKGAKPFLFDTPSLYKAKRYLVRGYHETARKNGFHQRTVGCPIKISNQSRAVVGKYLKKIMVADALYTAEGMVVLSHFKGHPDAGFGGAIKNLGMGAVARKTKKDIHTLSQPVINLKKCLGCGICVKVCPWHDVEIEKNKASFKYKECFGCGACIFNCPQKALKPKTAVFSDLLTEAALGVLKTFKKNKVFYVNVLMGITQMCDCITSGTLGEKGLVAPDVGILVSDDISAIEKASFDLVNKATDNKFEKIHAVDMKGQLKSAEKYQLGNQNYSLIKV